MLTLLALLPALLSGYVATSDGQCPSWEKDLGYRVELAACTSLPLDRRRPDGGSIPLFHVLSVPKAPALGHLVFFHGGPAVPSRGLPSSGPFWHLLLAHFEVLYFHQRGSGWSGRLEAPPSDPSLYSMEQSVLDARDLALEAWPARPPLLLLGKSAGGFLALKYALAYPSEVKGLILAATAADHRYLSQRRETLVLFYRALDEVFPGFLLQLSLARSRCEALGLAFQEVEDGVLTELSYSVATHDVLVKIVAELAEGRTEVLLREQARARRYLTFRDTGSEAAFLAIACTELGLDEPRACAPYQPAGATYDVGPRLHELAVPTLILSARYDGIVPPALQQKLAQGLGGPSSLVLLEHSGHMFLDDEPWDAASATAAFLGLPIQQNPQGFSLTSPPPTGYKCAR